MEFRDNQTEARPKDTVVNNNNTAAAPASERRGASKVEQIIYYIVGVVEALLAIRLLLALFNITDSVNNSNAFAQFIYSLTGPLVEPFNSLFTSNVSNDVPNIGAILVAMAVYALIGYGIAKLVRIASR